MAGQLIIVTGASGSGKSSIVNAILAKGIGTRVVTCTTRPPRTNNDVPELEGIDYFFLTEKKFCAQKKSGAFIEHAEVYGKHYGLRKSDIDTALVSSDLVFVIVNPKGALSLKRLFPNARGIFIHATKNDISERLRRRGDSPESIAKRLSALNAEQKCITCIEKIISNNNGEFAKAVTKLFSLLGTKK